MCAFILQKNVESFELVKSCLSTKANFPLVENVSRTQKLKQRAQKC